MHDGARRYRHLMFAGGALVELAGLHKIIGLVLAVRAAKAIGPAGVKQMISAGLFRSFFLGEAGPAIKSACITRFP